LDPLKNDRLSTPNDVGTPVLITGKVSDGRGDAVPDAVLEVWQANGRGRYAHPEDTRDLPLEKDWFGFGRIPTDGQGRFQFTTIKPGPVPGPKGQMQAPHIVVLVGMRGLLRHLLTRIYFPSEAANREDPILGLVPEERRHTLIARPGQGSGLEWNIVLQGTNETVFFSY
jgi:protocatechuate 3,4-dioxygenase alpha subunit